MKKTMRCCKCDRVRQHHGVHGERLYGFVTKIAAVFDCMICGTSRPAIVVDYDHWYGYIDPSLMIGCSGDCGVVRPHYVCLIRPMRDGHPAHAEVHLCCVDCNSEVRRYFAPGTIPVAMLESGSACNFMPA